MLNNLNSERMILFSYFLSVIVAGALILLIPGLWTGDEPLGLVDALFTSVSAVCVTGLITVDTAQFSRLGQFVILSLIQAGGLGIITFSSIYLTKSGKKVSFKNASIIKKYYIDDVEYKEKHIVRNIMIFTFLIEGIGALALYSRGAGLTFFEAVFHSVSAFCNAGFSTRSDSLVGFTREPGLLGIIMVLIILGGLGFVVIQDLMTRWTRPGRRLSLHSRIVLSTTAFLIVLGTLVYGMLEWDGVLAEFSPGGKILNALFQSVTTRTAGFNAVDQGALSTGSKFFTLPLMFIGGGSGSIAGGIKVSTIFIIVMAILKGRDHRGEIRVFHRKVKASAVTNAMLFASKAVALVFLALMALLITELPSAHDGITFETLAFEVFSALATVGLSTGITGMLSTAGKAVIILTMFAGRVGLVSLALPKFESYLDRHVEYPTGEVLIG